MNNINEQDADLIKITFKDNDELLLLTRNCVLGLPLTGAGKEVIKTTYADKALMEVMYRKILPKLNEFDLIGQISDRWMGVEEDIVGRSPETISQVIKYKNEVISMVDKGLKLLQDPDGEKVNLNYGKEEIETDTLGVKLLARNQYIKHFAGKIYELKAIANTKVETDKEKQKRLGDNSSK